MHPSGNGYDIYDLYDLGEFDQKGSVATKWGSKKDLVTLGQAAEELGMGVYWDAVLNHKAGADRKEKCLAVTVDPKGTISTPLFCPGFIDWKMWRLMARMI